MFQEIVVGLIFSGAVGYLGRLGYLQFFAKGASGCASGCSGCSSLDFDKIRAQIEKTKAGKSV